MENLPGFLIPRMNYLVYILLMLVGFYGIAVKKNYMKKIIGLNILQTSVILFFISVGAKQGASLPILFHGRKIVAADYINPLPHVLMLTAIVVAVATLGVALAMAIRIHREFGTMEEDKVLGLMAEPEESPPESGETGNNREKGGSHG